MEADAQRDALESLRSVDASDTVKLNETRLLLASLRPPEIASLLEASPPKARRIMWDLMDDETEHQVLQYLGEDVRADFLETMDTSQLLAVAGDMPMDDYVDLLQQLPAAVSAQVLSSMSASDRARLEEALAYPDDTAGGMMNTDAITVRPRHSVEIVLRYLRLRKDLPEATDSLIVVNNNDEYLGILPISRLLTTDPSVTVREVMVSDIDPIDVHTSDTEVARLFSELDLISAPVVNAQGRLLGRITIDDVVDVIIEDADEAILARAGLDLDEDTFAPVLKSLKGRTVWLGINLITAFIAAAVINVFEDTIAKVVALAVLMPIVASMGGIAGTQTLTVVIRGMALGHIGRSNLGWLLNREFVVAVLNGLFWAAIVALTAALAFQDVRLGAIIAVAIVINILVAAISGTLLPAILQRLKIDPAIAGGVILTTITDVTGFFVFLGSASWLYA